MIYQNYKPILLMALIKTLFRTFVPALNKDASSPMPAAAVVVSIFGWLLAALPATRTETMRLIYFFILSVPIVFVSSAPHPEEVITGWQ